MRFSLSYVDITDKNILWGEKHKHKLYYTQTTSQLDLKGMTVSFDKRIVVSGSWVHWYTFLMLYGKEISQLSFYLY